MVMKNLIFFWIIFRLWVFNGNAQTNTNQLNIALRTGDLLFCNSTSGELSKAIDQATQTAKATHFDHVGIVEIQHDTVWVLHAAPKKGVCRETIGQFLTSERGKITATAYRLKEKYSKAIPMSLITAHSLLGEPYKFSYILKDRGYYCSEYIYKIFSADSIFTLNPMTFKDPKTGQFISGWVDHYQKLGIPIPEGESGCNPNGMAGSEKLESMGEVKLIGKY
jgi:hypothetical protein